ncbi:hypothetical protein [Micrococcus luteus]|uniref:hypothetical protein n=1 Tax=Micrococcus luteus TaxID=1270 RepID=UPI0038794584
MTALALLALGVHDLATALLPHAWAARRREVLALAAGAAAAVLAALLLAVLAPASLALAVGGALVALALLGAWWLLGGDRPLGLLGVVGVVVLLAAAEAWLARPGQSSVPAALTVLAVGAALAETANRVTRAVLTLAGRPDETAVRPAPADPPAGSAPESPPLRGGRYIGPMERVLMVVLGLAQAWAVVAALMAAKGLVRFPEISADRGEGSRAEEFLVGSLASWGMAAGGALLVGAALGVPVLP